MDVARSYVAISWYQVCDLLLAFSEMGPRSWYRWMSSLSAGDLELAALDAIPTCGCGKLKIKAQLKGSWPWNLRKFDDADILCRFTPAQEVRVDAKCALCRLLAASLSAPGSIPSITRYIFGSTRSLKNEIKHVYGLEADLPGSLPILPLGDDAHLLGHLPDNYARCPDTANASRERILGWLHRCENEHTECQAMERQVLKRGCGPKRLLNTRTMAIESTQGLRKYFALSYVWGATPQPHVEGLESLRPGSAPLSVRHVHFPRVIRDAITITNDLGETYLWVDALCINQTDLSEKAHEIAKMNEIYLAAYMTIVALDAEDADSGLAGVNAYPSTRSRHVESIDEVRLAVVQPSLAEKYLRPDCHWNSRAWTMQEHLLSRRIIYMGSNQAYFSCFTATFSEDRHEADDPRHEKYRHPGRLLLNPPSGSPLLPWKVWSRLVELYSSRSTSVVGDRSPAFQGILNEQRQSWKMQFVEDMPIDFLPLALLWCHGPNTDESWKGLPIRIADRASWTWTGWTEEIHFTYYERYRSVIESIAISTSTDCTRYYYGAEGSLLPVQRALELGSQSSSLRPSVNAPDATHEAASDAYRSPHVVPMLSFQSQCVTLETVADNYRTNYLSIRGPNRKRAGFISHSTDAPPSSHRNNGVAVLSCMCVLLGVSWSPIGFFGNVEYFIGQTKEEKLPGNRYEDLERPNARHIERFENKRPTLLSSVEVGPIKHAYPKPQNRWEIWLARSLFASWAVTIALLSLFLVVTMSGVSVVLLGLIIAAFPITVILYAVYFSCLRPLWIWLDHFRYAHVLWIEEVADGVYKRNGIGKMKYPAFKKVNPKMQEIKLV